MSRRPVIACALMGAWLSACTPEVPAEPTWDEVGAILAANCARCHGDPQLLGAPSGFRLDLYQNEHAEPGDGDDVRVASYGAATLAPFIAERAGVRADMPPGGPPLTERQRDILIRWAEMEAPPGADGAAPTMRLVDPPQAANGEVALEYVIDPGDAFAIAGSLYLDQVAPEHLLEPSLHAGLGRIVWDSDQAAGGHHQLLAMLDNGSGPVVLELASIEVTRTGNAAPRAQILSPVADDLFVAGEPALVSLLLGDPDGDELAVEIQAVRGEERVEVAPATAAQPGPLTVTWDPAALAAADDWRLEVSLSDGTVERMTSSAPFIVSHETTDLRYTDVSPLITARCRPCHSAYVEVGLDAQAVASRWRGRIWRRVIDRQDMPPSSASGVVPDYEFISDAERQILGEWLLAGAPP